MHKPNTRPMHKKTDAKVRKRFGMCKYLTNYLLNICKDMSNLTGIGVHLGNVAAKGTWSATAASGKPTQTAAREYGHRRILAF